MICIKTVKVSIEYSESSDPIEILYRFVWGLIFYVIFTVLQIVLALAAIIQFVVIAVNRRRNPAIHHLTRAVFDYACENAAYISGLTDERSPLFPQF